MPRYILRQPRTLTRIAEKKLAIYIALRGEILAASISEMCRYDAQALISREIKLLQHRLDCSVPSEFRDDLFIETIQIFQKKVSLNDCEEQNCIQTNLIARMIQTLLTEKLEEITLNSEINENIFLPLLSTESHRLTGLLSLRFGVDLDTKEMCNDTVVIKKILRDLRNLKSVTFRFCTHEILESVAEYCKFIEKLVLTDIKTISDCCIDIFKQLLNLKDIRLEGTSVTQKGFEALLVSCKNIQYVTGTSYLIAGAVEQIAVSKGTDRLKLKSFENDHKTTAKQLQLIIQMCPGLESIYFDDCPLVRGDCSQGHSLIPESRLTPTQYNLIMLNTLHNLCKLQLKHYCFYRDKINNVLEIRGRDLGYLDLVIYELDSDALKCVMQMCPNLRSFHVGVLYHYREQNMRNKLRNSVKRLCTLATKMSQKRLRNSPLNNLTEISVDIGVFVPADVADQLIILILSNCPNVEDISTGFHVSLTDDLMFAVMDKNPLTKLKLLKMWKSNISTVFIDRLIKNCASPPTVQFFI